MWAVAVSVPGGNFDFTCIYMKGQKAENKNKNKILVILDAIKEL